MNGESKRENPAARAPLFTYHQGQPITPFFSSAAGIPVFISYLSSLITKRSAALRRFTLIELVVVLVIMALVAAIAVSAFRGESPAAALERSSYELESFCARVRYRAAETGRDYVVKLFAEDRKLCASPSYTDAEMEKLRDEGTAVEEMTLQLPENISAERELPENEEEEPVEAGEGAEIFRFFPDGGGVSLATLIYKSDTLGKRFDLSFLNGQLIVADGTEKAEDGAL